MSRLPSVRMLIVLLSAALVVTTTAQAQTTWHVDDDAPGDPGPGDPTISDSLEDGSAEHPFDAIQEGIDASMNGETVLVRDGTYTGEGNRDIDFAGRLITLRSENGPGTCIIDCQGSESDLHRGFWFDSSETADAMVDGFTITGGFTPGPGGGMFIFDGCHPTIANCRFSCNSAENGGGMYVSRGSNPVVIRCEFIDNNASDDGGGMYNLNGSSPAIIECLFSGNTAVDDGGGMCNWYLSSPVVLNSVFVGNYGGEGGAIYNHQSGSPVLVNCVLSGNSAILGAAMQTNGGMPVLSNCTIAGNVASSGAGGIRNIGTSSNPTLANCILWGNSGDQISDGYGSTAVTYSDVEGGWPGQGNIDADPLFVDADGPDDILGTADDDVHLSAGSPCIDAGSNGALPLDTHDLNTNGNTVEPIPFDLDDNPRIAWCNVDMGAYEYQGPFGDFYEDCDVDVDDYEIFEVCLWFSGPAEEPPFQECLGVFDFYSDGDVDLRDFAMFQLMFSP